jgi:preprotein translocase subunit YajC
MGILFLPILILIMYFMLIRPQQQRAREQRELLEDLEVGDDIVTAAGMYGRVSMLDGGTVFIKITDGVEIKITKESIVGLVSYDEEEDDDVTEDADEH